MEVNCDLCKKRFSETMGRGGTLEWSEFKTEEEEKSRGSKYRQHYRGVLKIFMSLLLIFLAPQCTGWDLLYGAE